MSMWRMSYVRCDICGNDGPMGDDAAECRDTARYYGWRRVTKRDVCPDCIGWSEDRKTWWVTRGDNYRELATTIAMSCSKPEAVMVTPSASRDR